IVQRDPASDAVKEAIAMFLSALGPSRSDDKKVESDMQASIKAVDGARSAMATPLNAVPGAGSTAPAMTVADGAAAAPAKIAQAETALGEAEAATEQKGKFKQKDTAKVEKASEDVKEAEQRVGVQGEEPKKPGLFKRFKDWLVSTVLNIKQRIKKVLQAAKAKIVNFTMDVLGVSKQMDELKTTTATDRSANEQAMTDAQESVAATDIAESKAKELAASIGKT
ncbi:MAG: hypothetical protein IT429_24625, partial [Gemmataceae bacterium]|nr:hypothetical protein [Gemmataceae bacterium]